MRGLIFFMIIKKFSAGHQKAASVSGKRHSKSKSIKMLKTQKNAMIIWFLMSKSCKFNDA